MQKKALIQVIGIQQFPEGEEEKLDFITSGSFYQRQGIYYIIYQESEITGMQGVTTSLRIEGESIILNRMGNVELKQVFQEGVLHRSTYITQFGTFWLSCDTHKIESDLTAKGGRISLEYDLFVDDSLLSHNQLRIIIKEEPPR